MATFNDRITELYEEARDRDYTVGRKKFAEILGVTRGQINGWLENAGNPDLETLKKIADKAGVSTSWLIGEDDRRNYPSFEMSGLTPEAQRDYDLLLEFLRFKHRRETRQSEQIKYLKENSIDQK